MSESDEHVGRFSLDEYYDAYPRIEEQFQAELEKSLGPRGPAHLYHVVAGLRLSATAVAADVGCGEGDQALELARRFGFTVHGVDPVERHLELANASLQQESDGMRSRVQFYSGTAEAIPLGDGSVDLIWCREVLYHVPHLDGAFAEFRRVLSGEGCVVIYQLFNTNRLEPREADWFWATTNVSPGNADQRLMEDAIAAARLRVIENIELGSETVEWVEEQNGRPLVSCDQQLDSCVTRSGTSSASGLTPTTSSSPTASGTSTG